MVAPAKASNAAASTATSRFISIGEKLSANILFAQRGTHEKRQPECVRGPAPGSSFAHVRDCGGPAFDRRGQEGGCSYREVACRCEAGRQRPGSGWLDGTSLGGPTG